MVIIQVGKGTYALFHALTHPFLCTLDRVFSSWYVLPVMVVELHFTLPYGCDIHSLGV